MKEIGVEELKRIQLEILLAVDAFCRKENINYSLAAGTLLGAIRHKGYIPWDDDIDIMMPRPDYDKFVNKFNGTYDNLYVVSPELNWNFYAPYANVCDKRTILNEGANGHRGIEMGIKIDVFPSDGMPINYSEYTAKIKRIQEINMILRAKRFVLHKMPIKSYREILKYLRLRMITCLKSYASYQKELHSIATSCSFEGAENVKAWVFSTTKDSFPASIFDLYTDIEFEGKHVRAIKQYDVYLRKLYGDYMQLPPEEKRLPHHGFTAYWKD